MDPSPTVRKSLELQQVLRAAGYVRGPGVSTAGIRLLARLAREHGLRDWHHTRDEAGYDALIAVVRSHLPAPCPG